MRNVVLMIANTSWFGKRPWKEMLIAPLILTRLLKNEFNFHIIDSNINDYTQIETELKLTEIMPDCIMITSLSVEYAKEYHACASIAKNVFSDIPVVMGGVYPTVMESEVMEDQNVDYIFLGHAEERICEFLKIVFGQDKNKLAKFDGIGFRRDNKIILNPVKSFITKLKTMIKPDYSKTDVELYLQGGSGKMKGSYIFHTKDRSANIITSYGCPYNCVFCASRTISGRGVAFRDINDVLEEIEYFINRYNVINFNFLDDCIFYDKDRAKKLFNEFIKRKYRIRWKLMNVSAWHLNEELISLIREAGCEQITISVESGSDRVLKEIIRKPLDKRIVKPLIKICNDNELIINGNFVIGFPGETWDEIRETIWFAEYCDFDMINIYIATIFPKTDLYNIAISEKLLPDDFSFLNPEYFGLGKGAITTTEFSPVELQILRAYEWDRINFKTIDKREKIAKSIGITIKELEEHRRNTRLKLGVHYYSV